MLPDLKRRSCCDEMPYFIKMPKSSLLRLSVCHMISGYATPGHAAAPSRLRKQRAQPTAAMISFRDASTPARGRGDGLTPEQPSIHDTPHLLMVNITRLSFDVPPIAAAPRRAHSRRQRIAPPRAIISPIHADAAPFRQRRPSHSQHAISAFSPAEE